VATDDQIRQRFAEPIEISRADRILETGQRGLGSQSIPVDRVAPQQCLVDRVFGETSSVVAVGVTASQSVDPLGDELAQLVLDLSRLALIRQAAAERVDQPETTIGGLEQQRTAIGTAVLLVELGNNGLVEKIREQQTLCRGMIAHAKASGVVESLVATAFYHMEAFRVSNLMHNPG
jgi:hypothetical protein